MRAMKTAPPGCLQLLSARSGSSRHSDRLAQFRNFLMAIL